MNVAGIGLDIIDVAHMKKVLSGKAGKRFVENTFTEREASCAGKSIARFATNFAAKEAVYKAFETGWMEGRDVELLRDAQTGAPRIMLHGKMAKIAKKRKIKKVLVSLSYTKSAAVAVALLLTS